jgi:preprotein translocase subunit SecF
MQLFDRVPNIDFMGPRRMAVALSATLIVISLVSFFVRGLELGLEFTSGILIEVGYDSPADLDAIRTALDSSGHSDAVVQNFGPLTDVLIRLPPISAEDEAQGVDIGDAVLTVLRAQDSSVEERRTEFVGPQIGEDLVEAGGTAMLFVLIMVFAYIMIRFRWKFAAGAIAALVHDVILTFGFFSLVGLEFDQSVLAAVLAVIGYSLNDTIVVYDRIRENFRAMRRGTPESIVNASINQTLSRTVITGITTLVVLLALLFLGGETVGGFSIALIVGIVVGTYSSIYVASAAALFLDVSPADLIPPKREEIDDLP